MEEEVIEEVDSCLEEAEEDLQDLVEPYQVVEEVIKQGLEAPSQAVEEEA